jgi:hypothetical protein
VLELSDLEAVAVASPRGSPQLGGHPAVLYRIRFLHRVSTGDCSEIIGPGWHLLVLAGPYNMKQGGFFLGARNLPDQLMGCSGLCALDRISISLDISTERAQGHFLSPWSKSGTLYTK